MTNLKSCTQQIYEINEQLSKIFDYDILLKALNEEENIFYVLSDLNTYNRLIQHFVIQYNENKIQNEIIKANMIDHNKMRNKYSKTIVSFK
jgi:hypothetical protein